jgi:hypothetical protein
MPTVYFTTSQFNENAHLSAEDNGVPNMRIVAVAADLYYRERISKERAAPVAKEYFEEAIAKLTKPVTAEEKNPNRKTESRGTIKITGESLEAALENVNDQFLSSQWTDGLPIVAPTPERVKWMLSGTTRSPEEEIGPVSPRNGMATVEKVAINAVMAGAKPEYLPVILAIVDALADPVFDELHFATSTGSFNLVIGVSGPIADEIGMNSGLGLFSFGNRANSTIGRAARMAMINLGHTWPAANDMALVGRPGAHAFPTFAENQAQSPWTSYRVSEGYAESDSIVTISVTGGYGQMGGTKIYGGGAVALVPPENVLQSIIDDIKSGRGGVRETPNGPMSGFGSSHRKFFIIFNPEVAQELNSRLGYTRESLQAYIDDQTSVAFENLHPAEIASVQRAIKSGYIPADRVEAFEAGLKPGGKVPGLLRPTDAHFMVAGGIPGYTITMSSYRNGIYKPESHISKPISGATLTQAGRTSSQDGLAAKH